MKKPKFSERSGSFAGADIWHGKAGGAGADESGANVDFDKGVAGGVGARGKGAGGVGANKNASNMSGGSGGGGFESAMAGYGGLPPGEVM